MGMKPATSTADLTNKLMVAIQAEWPESRLWKMTQGGGYPSATIKAVLGIMMRGQWQEALQLLRRAPVIMFGGIPGLPDLDGMIPINGYGVRLGIEVKYGRDQQRPEQITCQRIYDQSRAIYIVARDVEQCLADLRSAIQQAVEPGTTAPDPRF